MTKPWAENKETILEYYQSQKLPLQQVIIIMKKSFGFEASQRAYREKFRTWGIHKYNRKNTTAFPNQSTPKADRTENNVPSPAAGRPMRRGRPLYVANPPTASQDTPRPVHARTALRPDSLQIMPPMALPYPTPSPTPNMGYVGDSLANHAGLFTPQTPREHYQYPGTQHTVLRADKIPTKASESTEMQSTMGQRSPSSFLLPTADNSTPLKTESWQHSQDSLRDQADSSDYKSSYSHSTALDSFGSRYQNATFRKPTLTWDDTHDTMEVDSHNDHEKLSDQHHGEKASAHGQGFKQPLHQDRHIHGYPPYKTQPQSQSQSQSQSLPMPFDYTEYQYQDKPYYSTGQQPNQSQSCHEQSSKQRVWGVSEIASGPAPAFEPRRYSLPPSPPHSHAQLCSSGTKALEERSAAARTSPLTPSSLPDISAQTSLQRGQAKMHSQGPGSVYHSDPLAMAMDFGGAYATSVSSSDSVSTPPLSSSLSSSSSMSPHNHPPLYPSYHIF